jgi:predicted dehydrogenase
VSSSDELGVVVVGTGFGRLGHVPAIRAAGLSVRAMVGRDPAKTAERCAEVGVTPCSSLEEALALDGVDAVTVATPPHTHAELVVQATRAGKHVVCEKPFAANLVESRQMLAAAEAAGVVHLQCTQFRLSPSYVAMANAVASGDIGEPRLVTFIDHMPVFSDATVGASWVADRESGGGWLGAFGSHAVDQLRYVLHDDVTHVAAGLPTVVRSDWTADDTFSVRFRTRKGAEGVLQSTAADAAPMLSVRRVVGARGTVWSDGGKVCVATAEGVQDLDTAAVPVPEGLGDVPPGVYPLAVLYRVLAARAAPDTARPVPGLTPATFADGVACMAVLDAIRASTASGGSWTAVSTPDGPGSSTPTS